MMGNFMKFCSDEPLDVMINPHRVDEQESARAAGATRLQGLGVRLTGTESGDEMADLVDVVEFFEHAVQARGGDLMVDEGPQGTASEPDDSHFVLPVRAAHESVAAFVGRIAEAAAKLRHHRAIN